MMESELQIPIALDRYELNNMNIPVDRPITFTSDGLTARAALAGMLHAYSS